MTLELDLSPVGIIRLPHLLTLDTHIQRSLPPVFTDSFSEPS